MYIGSSPNIPVYSLLCVAESSLNPHSLYRASESFMLEGPTLFKQADMFADNIKWFNTLVGLYKLPNAFTQFWSDENEANANDNLGVQPKINVPKRLPDLSTM